MKCNKYNILLNILIVLLYIQVTSVFFLAPPIISKVLFPIIVFYIFFMICIILLKKYDIDRRIKKIIRIYSFFIVYIVSLGIYVTIFKNQEFYKMIIEISYFLYFYIVILFGVKNINIRSTIKLIIFLDFVMSIFYNISFIMQKSVLNVSYRYEQVGNLNLLRIYAQAMFLYFSIGVLLWCILKKQFIYFNKILTYIFFISILSSALFYLTRSLWVTLVVEIIYLSIKILNDKKRKFNLKVFVFVIMSAIFFIVILPKVFPNINERFLSSFNEIGSDSGTLNVRQEMFNERYNYIKDNNSLLFGLGPLSNDSGILFYSGVDSGSMFIKNVDNAYAQLITQYGLVGTIGYVLLLLYSTNILKTNKNNILINIYFISIVLLIICGWFGNGIITKQIPALAVFYGIACSISMNEK